LGASFHELAANVEGLFDARRHLWRGRATTSEPRWPRCRRCWRPSRTASPTRPLPAGLAKAGAHAGSPRRRPLRARANRRRRAHARAPGGFPFRARASRVARPRGRGECAPRSPERPVRRRPAGRLRPGQGRASPLQPAHERTPAHAVRRLRRRRRRAARGGGARKRRGHRRGDSVRGAPRVFDRFWRGDRARFP
jgi:hypothetical protein